MNCVSYPTFIRFMLTQHRRPVCLSFISTDLPICCEVEALATLYQKDPERFHLVFTEPAICDRLPVPGHPNTTELVAIETPRLLWLELSPYRVTMTMQGNGQYSYRHFWEQGVYGLSRFWLYSNTTHASDQLCLRNFTRKLTLQTQELPTFLRVEYELWSGQLPMGRYVLNLEIQA